MVTDGVDVFIRVITPEYVIKSDFTVDLAENTHSTQLILKVADTISVPLTLKVPYEGHFTYTISMAGSWELVCGPPGMSLTGNVLDWPYSSSDDNQMFEVEIHSYEGFAYNSILGAVMHWGVPSHLRKACLGLVYSYRPTIAGELPSSLPVVYTVESATPDLTISSDGTISYTGNLSDSFEISLTAAGLTYYSLFSLTVNPACSPISLVLPAQVCGLPNTISHTSLFVSDTEFSGPGAHQWTITGLAVSMTVDYSGLWPEIWWVPEPGDSGVTVNVEVSNVGGVTDSATVDFVVNLPPILEAISDLEVDSFCQLNYPFLYSDPENDPLMTFISPSTLSLIGDFIVSGTPPVPDLYTVSVSVRTR